MRFKIDLASLIVGRKFTDFALFYFIFEANFQVQAPPGGAYIWRGDLTEGFFVTSLGAFYLEGLTDIWRGLFLEFYSSYQLNDHWHYELETFFYMNFFSDILMQIKFNYTRQVLHLALF